ncbi:MAG: hypothetical protein QOG08_1615 [Chloroflexota bacterium]|nr:hypothetical protein [Chloroflexota bacterium]
MRDLPGELIAAKHGVGTQRPQLFRVVARTGTTWSQQARLVASDGAVAEFYGWSVAISGSTAVVGGPGDAGNTGTAYVYLLP